MKERQVVQRIDYQEAIRQHLLSFKQKKPKKTRRSFRKMMGSYRLFKCEFCGVTICTRFAGENGKCICDCGREAYPVLVPNLYFT